MIKNYIKIAWRNLKRNKAYALISMTGLCLGMLCGILIFTLITYHLSFDNFHHNANRIYRTYTEWRDDENISRSPGVPQPLGKAFHNNFALGEKTARVISFRDNLVSFTDKGEVKKFNEEEGAAFTEPEFFDILNFPLVMGDSKNILNKPGEALITQKLAKKYFGSENAAMNKVIRVDNTTNFTITGILKDLPPNTDRKNELYVSYADLKQYTNDKDGHRENNWGGVFSGSQVFTLLKPQVTKAQAEDALAQLIKTNYKGRDLKVWHFKLQPLTDIHFNADLDGYADRKYLWALFFIGIFLIVTACVNFVNLATAQALNRAKEVGVRKVLGSIPQQLFWQFIAETTLITVVAVALSICFAGLLLQPVNNLFQSQMSFNWLVLSLFITGITILVIFLSGSYPGLVLARFQPIAALKNRLSQENAGGFTLRRALVIVQFSISQALIIGAVIVISQLHYSQTADLGFTKNAVVMLPIPQNDNKDKLNTFNNRIAEIPGVEKSSLCFAAPAAQSNNSTNIRFDGRTEDEHWGVNTKTADANYLSTFDIKLVAGRNFFPADTTREFLVNETFVRKLNLKPADVIGKTMKINGHTSGAIVGVVKDFYNFGTHTEIAPICIMPEYRQYQSCAVRINMRNASTLPAIQKVWDDTFPNDLYSYKFLDDKLAKFYELDTTLLTLVEAFAGIAVFIGCLGLYGLVSFMAVRKTKEIGVRKVLGASIYQILWLFGKEFTRLLVIAFLIAAPLAWWAMTNYLQDFHYRISIGPAIFLTSIVATFIIATVTVGYRATVSALTNPVKSLRSE